MIEIETLGKNWVWLLLDLDLGLGSWLSVCGVRRWLCAPGMPPVHRLRNPPLHSPSYTRFSEHPEFFA